MEGYPLPENGGNVLLPYSVLKLSLRLPPICDADAAMAAVKETLEKDPPYGAEVTYDGPRADNGWNAPATAPWLARALDKASHSAFGKPVAFLGEGGSIPFMAMLGAKFPQTQFVVTGVLGPHSNAHGPNEFLHIAMAKKVSACIASILADQASDMSFLYSTDDDDPKRAARRPMLAFILVTLLVGAAASDFHRAVHSHLVCRPAPPRHRAAQLGVRAGLDHTVCADGGGGVAGMAHHRHEIAGDGAPMPFSCS